MHPKLVGETIFQTLQLKIKGLSCTWPTLFSSSFKGLKFQKLNSSTFKVCLSTEILNVTLDLHTEEGSLEGYLFIQVA